MKIYFREDLLIRRIERSPRGYLLKAISKIYYFHEDLLVWRITRLPREYLLEATSKPFSWRPPRREDSKIAKRLFSQGDTKKTIFMKTPLPGGLKSRREFISSRRRQEAYFHEGLLIRKIEESSKVISSRWSQKIIFRKTSSPEGLKNRQGIISPKHIKKTSFVKIGSL